MTTPLAAPPPDSWYYLTSSETGIPQWVNLNHVMRMLPDGKGGSRLVFSDGSVGQFVEPMPGP